MMVVGWLFFSPYGVIEAAVLICLVLSRWRSKGTSGVWWGFKDLDVGWCELPGRFFLVVFLR